MASTLFRGPVLVGKKDTSGYNIETKGSSYTVVISTDSGKTFISNTDGVVFTLPSIAIGNVFTFVNTGQDSTNGMVITGAGGEYIIYKGVVNQITLTNTKATSKVGDYVKIAGDKTGTWWAVVDIQGVWA